MDFFQSIYEWFTVDVYTFVKDLFVYLGYKLVWLRIKMMAQLYSIAWSIAYALIQDLQILSNWHTVLTFIPAPLKAQLEFFNVFTGISWMFNSLATKFTLRFFKMG